LGKKQRDFIDEKMVERLQEAEMAERMAAAIRNWQELYDSTRVELDRQNREAHAGRNPVNQAELDAFARAHDRPDDGEGDLSGGGTEDENDRDHPLIALNLPLNSDTTMLTANMS
jgi:hypothetical protein